MALYVGGTVNFGDNVEASPEEGDIWYNDGKFCFGTSLSFGGAWSSGGNVSTARMLLAGAGTQSAGLCMGGDDLHQLLEKDTEEYNGTSWSAGGDLAYARSGLAGCGTQSAGLCMGEDSYSNNGITEEYDGHHGQVVAT